MAPVPRDHLHASTAAGPFRQQRSDEERNDYAGSHLDLKQTNEASPVADRSNLRKIERASHCKSTNRQATNEPNRENKNPFPRNWLDHRNRRNRIDRGASCDEISPPNSIGKPTRQERSTHGPPERDRDG
jgi:hypothetical protein